MLARMHEYWNDQGEKANTDASRKEYCNGRCAKKETSVSRKEKPKKEAIPSTLVETSIRLSKC